MDSTVTSESREPRLDEARNISEGQANSSSSLFIKKFSVFDSKHAKQAIESIVEVADGFSSEQPDLVDAFVRQSSKTKAVEEADAQLRNLSLGDRFVCTTCNFQFTDREEQIAHFKCDLHLFNIKQKLRGKPVCASVEEFEQLSDISSISGSDTEDDEDDFSSSSSADESSGRNKALNSSLNATDYVSVARGKPKISFRLNDSNIMVMFRCLLHGKKNIPEKKEDVLSMVKSISPDDHWCIVLIAAGHFAAAIFKGDEPLVHKTFHRYVVRAKRGTVQSQHDSHRHAKSAGANIRRHHEAAFKDDIRLLLGTEWKAELDRCKCIFIRVPRYNRPVLVTTNTTAGGQGQSNALKAPFDKNDTRLRNIPFMTFRPTFNEVKRTHTILSKVELFKPEYLDLTSKLAEKKVVEKEASKKLKNSPKPVKSTEEAAESSKKKAKKKKPVAKIQSDDEDEVSNEDSEDEDEDDDLQVHADYEGNAGAADKVVTDDDFIQSLDASTLKYFNEFYTCCITNNSQKLVDKLSEFKAHVNSSESDKLVEKLLNKRINKENGFTLLHLSSELGNHECVWQLLMNGADPSVPDLTRQTRVPYNIASNKQSRDQFRLFMNDFPERYDYKQARIPDPISRDKLNEKAEKEKEKRKQQRKLKRERQAESKKAESEEKAEAREREKFLSLTDEQKRALASNQIPSSESSASSAVPPFSFSSASNSLFSSAPAPAASSSSAKPAPALPKLKVATRCWFCGVDISTMSQPFEYFDFKFCSARCLRAHRYQPPAKSK